MKTAPIIPASVDFSDPAAPRAPAFDDLYHSRAGAFEQARHVFLDGNRLPERWNNRSRFVILETGFGLGNNFLATWAAWRDDPDRCDRLIFISTEQHPLRRDDLVRAHAQSPAPSLAAQLIDAWPPLAPSLHSLDFENGRVRLMLAFGDARDWLPELVAEVDAVYLDGFSPSRHPDLWDGDLMRQIGRLATPGATVATWSVFPPMMEALAAAGFVVGKRRGFGHKTRMTVGTHQPRHRPTLPPGRRPQAPHAREVLVIGAGIAGAACARALAAQGLRPTVLEAAASVASRASGNPGGLFHGTLHAEDGPHARFNRAAALLTERLLRRAGTSLPWLQWGLLRVERDTAAIDAMRALQVRTGLPPDYVQALDAEAASDLAGRRLNHPAWFFPGGGAVSPPALTRAWLDEAGAAPRLDRPVARLTRSTEGRWLALDAEGHALAEADAVVLAAGTANAARARPWTAGQAWPWVAQRGQLSLLAADRAPSPLRLPVAGVGYALSLPDGRWCYGASADAHDLNPELRASDQAQNLARLHQLLPDLVLPDDLTLDGRVAWRSLVPDRLPLVGALPAAAPTQRAEQARFWERHPGLMICGGLASRGLTWAALCGELVAAQLTGAPWPVETSLADAVDPARFGAKSRRQSP